MTNIKEVAKKANVSIASVSRFLNNPETIREDTRESVKKAIQELNYRPSLIARGMRKQKSGYIALVLEDIENPFYIKIWNGAYQCAAERNYNLVLFDAKRSQEKNFFMDMIVGGKFDGAIYCMSMKKEYIKFLNELRKSDIAVVLIDNESFKNDFTVINTDNYKASYNGTEYLINKGHRDIVLVCYNKFFDEVDLRIKGYRDALTAYSIDFNPLNIFETDLSIEGGQLVAKKIAPKLRKFTAIFSVSDIVAIGILQYFNSNKIIVPGDVSILGFDDIIWSKIISPSLTTIHQKSFKKGYLAVEKIIEKLQGKQKKEISIELGTAIIERESVKTLV